MIRMVQSNSAGHAKDYFSDALLKSDYYLDDQEMQGHLKGKLGDRVGISGIATKDNFFALCENRNPTTGEPLTPRTQEARRVGYDINFHVPKSVSLVHALSNDAHIMKAFQSSLHETMTDIEADSKARVRKNGKFEDRDTGELVWAEFVHQTARPVDGSVPDPHLHAHCFVFNATFDAAEKKIKAGEFGKIKFDMPFYQARFQKRLSDKMIDLGYQVKRTQNSFELVGVPKTVLEMFSKRTNEIGEFAKKNNITDEKQLDEIGARIRSKKQKGLTMAELKQEWRKQIREQVNYSEGDKEALIRNAPNKKLVKIFAEECINHTLEHSFERASVVGERRLLASAYRHAIGDNSVSIKEITKSFDQDERIIRVKEKNRMLCTMPEILSEERRMVELAHAGMGRFQPLYFKAPKIELKDQQAAAAANILTTKNQVSIIRGAAGAGKTTMMKETVRLIENTGKKVTVVAPTSQASRGVLVAEGFKDADTVARLLVDKEMQEGLKNQVLFVDEAGLLGTKDMVDILKLTQKQNARLVLVGDTRQHSSVVRGDALRILNTVGGVKTANVSKIFRQKDNPAYLAIVQDLSQGNIGPAFNKMDEIGYIKTIDPLKPNLILVEDYIEAIKTKHTALIVSPTHKQAESVTEELRKKLRTAKLIGQREIEAVRLSNLNLTVAEKSDVRNYKNGQVVQFNQNTKGIKRGSKWEIIQLNEKSIILSDGKGGQQKLPIDKADIFSVYNKSEISLSKGDKVRVTCGSFDENDKRLLNGQSLEVSSVEKSGVIKLVNQQGKGSYLLNKDFGHISHDYCTTSHSSQGKTVDQVFISQPASTFPATDAKQFYVSLSRGKYKATVYTDDKVALLEHASEIGDRQSAMELVAGDNKHLGYVIQKEREQLQSRNNMGVSKQKDLVNQPNKDRDYEPRL